MRILLDHGADPNLCNTKNNTALECAAGKGLRGAVLLLLERGASVNLQVEGRPTALTAAAVYGHLEILSDVLAAGADPNLVTGYGGTSLFMALLGNNPEATEMLMAFGADVTVADDSALAIAASDGYAHIVTQILAKTGAASVDEEAFVNARASNGKTALMEACKKGRESVVQLLLQLPKINVDIRDEKYYTAMMHAICADHDGIAKALPAHGASVKPDAPAGTSALIEASIMGRRSVVRLIMDSMKRGGEEAGVDFGGVSGRTALMWACYDNFMGIAEMLLRAGAAMDVMDANGDTPLMFVVTVERGAEMAHMLLERGADPNVHGPQTSPLILACVRSAPEFGAVCQALVRAGADVHA
jgi:ankyrin repeat protein